jgi:putative spermidine/putrescine transport system substrate-binding protein
VRRTSEAATSGGASASAATSVADFGTFADLEKAAKAEGQLNVIALPHDWANYGEIISLFSKRYPDITVNEQSPDASSAEEIQAAKTNEGLDTAPDVFDLGLSVALQNTDRSPLQGADVGRRPRRPEGADRPVRRRLRRVHVDRLRLLKFPAPTKLTDLLSPTYKGAVAINGDPTQAGAAFAAVGIATVQSGGTLDDFQPGIDFFARCRRRATS